MVMKISETQAEKHKQIAEHNETRLRRAQLWLSRAKSATKYSPAKILDDSSVRFIFYWIAFEAAYSIRSNSGSHRMNRVIRRIINEDQKQANKLVKKLRSTIRELVNLPPTHYEFWEHVENQTYNQWKKKFKNENEKCETGTAEEVLPIVFERLRVVRHQIFHGANSRHKSYGGLQVKCGQELLAEFVPHFIETIQKSIDRDPKEDWGKVPFPRQGVRNQKDLKPIWAVNKQ